MAKRYIADSFEVSGGVGANVLLDDGTTTVLPISFDSTSSTRLANTSGTNTGDNAVNTLYSGLISFDSTSSTRLANTSGTNTGDNAVNTLYSGLVTNATHTGEVTGSTALTIASDVVDLDNLANEQKARVVLSTANIDWSLGTDFTKTLAANWTITETNLPTGTDTKCIVVYVTGAFTITPPAYWKKHGTGAYDGAKINMFVIDCLNGTGASEDVKYTIIPAV